MNKFVILLLLISLFVQNAYSAVLLLKTKKSVSSPQKDRQIRIKESQVIVNHAKEHIAFLEKCIQEKEELLAEHREELNKLLEDLDVKSDWVC